MSNDDWRSKAPSEKQIALCTKLGFTPIPTTAGEMKDFLDKKLGGNKSSGKSGSGWTPKPMEEITVVLPAYDVKAIEKVTGPITDELLARLFIVRKHCFEAGVKAGPSVGMLFNQVCEEERTRK